MKKLKSFSLWPTSLLTSGSGLVKLLKILYYKSGFPVQGKEAAFSWENPSAFSSMSDLPSFSRDDIRYAAETANWCMNRTAALILLAMPTFVVGFNFLLLSELMDEVNVVRVHSSWVEAEKPKIIRYLQQGFSIPSSYGSVTYC